MSGIDEYTKLMLHMDDTQLSDGGEEGHTTTLYGNAARSSSQSKFGGYSAYFDGSDSYIQVSDSEDFNFGSSTNFTIDFWVRFNSMVGTSGAIWLLCNEASDRRVRLEYSNGAWRWNLDQFGSTNIKAGNPTINTWYHVAIVRNGSTTVMYVDGSSIGSTSNSNVNLNAFFIGKDGGGTQKDLDGYIDELRISKGIARWTSNFTPPTEAYSKPATYKISGSLNNDARVIIIEENGWTIESNTTASEGNYEVDLGATASGNVLVIARKSDGEALVYGDVAPNLTTS